MTILDRGAAITIIAEVAQAHDGSLGTAHAYIDAVAEAGAKAVKFQTHIAAAESTPAEPWRINFSFQDASRYDYWKRMEFTRDQWVGLRDHAVKRGLIFLSSPFSCEAVRLLREVGVAAWKIPSGEVSNFLLLDEICKDELPVILSSGLSDLAELRATVNLLQRRGKEVAVMQCTTSYPCPPEQIGLNVLQTIRQELGVEAGLSDHSGTIYAGLAAATLGATLVEVHVAFSRAQFGPDVSSSVVLEELRLLVQGCEFITKALSAPVDKGAISSQCAALRSVFGRSLVASRSLPRGTVLNRDDVAAKKPAGGLAPHELGIVIGRRLKRDLDPDDLLRACDLEEE